MRLKKTKWSFLWKSQAAFHINYKKILKWQKSCVENSNNFIVIYEWWNWNFCLYKTICIWLPKINGHILIHLVMIITFLVESCKSELSQKFEKLNCIKYCEHYLWYWLYIRQSCKSYLRAGSCTSELYVCRLKVNCKENLGWLGQQLAGYLAQIFFTIHFQYTIHLYMIRPYVLSKKGSPPW